MWSIVNKERGKGNSPHLDFTDVVKLPDGTDFQSKKCAVDSINMQFLNAATACGAPRAQIARASAALGSARLPADRSLRFRLFNSREVLTIITTRIPPKPSKDIYGISMKLLRLVVKTLAPVLTDLFNTCIKEGSFPLPLKISKVSPLFKGKGKRSCIDNYRPVAIIPAVAKIFENGLSSRLIAFLSETNALSNRQYAYREGRSTTSLTRELVRSIMAARERKQQVAVLSCDLSKAFDVADHGVLAVKLKHYGVSGASYNLMVDMMQDRSQIVVGGDGGEARSDPLASVMGVAQGSSISNIMFSLLLNDLPDAITTAEVFMYADDVAAVVTASSVDQLEHKLNCVSSELADWFLINGLALNLTKTHFIHFDLSGRMMRPLTVLVDGKSIVQVQSIKFLGFELDRGLKWDKHIDKVCGKLGSACFALGRVARVVPSEVARSCYFATIHSLLQYGTELWGRAADWLRAFKMQKRAIRAIAKVPYATPARPYFRKLGVLTVPALVIFQVAVYARTNLASYITYSNVHAHNTRNRDKLVGIARTLTKSTKVTYVMGPVVYNKLPAHITTATTHCGFKNKLKRWLIEQAFYSFEEFINLK